jgi:hypothetical protein
MNATIKTFLIRTVAIATVAGGMIGTANAGYTTCNAFQCFYVPTCHNHWIQTGPFAGQGYYTQVCR